MICGFEIKPNDIPDITTKSVYKECLIGKDTFKGKAYWIARLRQKNNGLQLEVFKQEKESMIFKDEAPNCLVEYEENTLLITSAPAHSYIVKDW